MSLVRRINNSTTKNNATIRRAIFSNHLGRFSKTLANCVDVVKDSSLSHFRRTEFELLSHCREGINTGTRIHCLFLVRTIWLILIFCVEDSSFLMNKIYIFNTDRIRRPKELLSLHFQDFSLLYYFSKSR